MKLRAYNNTKTDNYGKNLNTNHKHDPTKTMGDENYLYTGENHQ